MKKAASITTEAHIRAMQYVKPGMYEYQLEAEYLYAFNKNGARSPAYNSIVGGGNNSCILHYVENNDELKDGDLVLVDAGCEYEYYASDVTRTFPVNGKFSAEQKEIYSIVLEAHHQSMNQAQPGNKPKHAHRCILQSCVELGREGQVVPKRQPLLFVLPWNQIRMRCWLVTYWSAFVPYNSGCANFAILQKSAQFDP